MNTEGMTWNFLFKQATLFVRDHVPADKKTLVLQPQSRLGSLYLLAIGLCSGRDLVLDEKALCTLQDGDSLILKDEQLPAAWLSGTPMLRLEAELPNPVLDWEHLRLRLCTSGSTGEPKLIEKSGRGLLAELNDLAEIFQLQPGDDILSLVSPLHIYGLLHSFLLPLRENCSVQFVSFAAGLIDPIPSPVQGFKLVIAVPATWSYVKDLLDQQQLDTLVMSGAPFGDLRRRELQERIHRPKHCLEILGSTETGGLGYRRLLDHEHYFTPMPSLSFVRQEGICRVISPFLWPETSLEISDRLEFADDGRFLHLGRADRIFKYAGQRYSLSELEKILSECLGGVEVVARFQSAERVAQGGWLEAWLEASSPDSLTPLRQAFRQKTRAPFPQNLHWLPQFPRDAQGKIQIFRSESLPPSATINPE